MDLTAEPGPNNDSWAVARWLAWLMPLLAASFLMRRAQLHRRKGAGFVTIAAIILIARYLLVAMPPLFAFGAWEPGAALWPIGSALMLIGAARARKEDASSHERPGGIGWLRLLAFGIMLILAALWIDVDPAAYVFAMGTTALITGILMLPPGRASARRLTHGWIGRLLAAPLLLGAVMIAVPTFVALGDRSGSTVRVEFLFTPERPDLWLALLMLSVVAGPVMAAIDVTRRGSVGPFSLGGATASVSWMFVPSIIAFFGPGDWFAPLRNAETNRILAGALLVWATLFLPLTRQTSDSSDPQTKLAIEE